MNSVILTLALTGLIGINHSSSAALPLQGTRWTLTQIKPGAAAITLGILIEHPTLQFQGSRVNGSTGCSPLKATVRVSGARIRFSGIDAGTTEHCADHPLALRDDFTRLLENATQYRIAGRTLTIYAGKTAAAHGAQWLKFTAQSESNTPPPTAGVQVGADQAR